MNPQTAYDELIVRSRELSLLGSCSAVLGWDEQTYMPRGGASHRGAQMALLAGLCHDRATDPRFGELLSTIEGSPLVTAPLSVAAVNVRELRRAFDRKVLLPKSLVEDLARTTSLAQPEWVEARAANNFGRFRPWLERIVHLKQQEAACVARSVSSEPLAHVPAHASSEPAAAHRALRAPQAYDALLDEYEPGANSAELSSLFRDLRRELVPLVESVSAAARKTSGEKSPNSTTVDQSGEAILRRSFPNDRQRVFAETVAASIGFDFHRGRLDVAPHPFCSGIGPGDCRITTRFDEHHFSDAFFGVLHEVGHGLYEQGLDPEHHGTPMGEAVSLGIHESQSRLWENAVARRRSFWSYWFPLARNVFREALSGVSLDEFHAAVNHVSPSLIRVQADEATYNLHIIVRFELELALISGDLAVVDLPSAWNEKYRETLGVTPRNDAEGCLQDIHWSAGLIGYFPTYTLGNLYAAQLFAKADADLGGLDEPLARGDSAGLLTWLRSNIHSQGHRHHPAALIEHATGQKPSHRPLIDGLRRKYTELHGI